MKKIIRRKKTHSIKEGTRTPDYPLRWNVSASGCSKTTGCSFQPQSWLGHSKETTSSMKSKRIHLSPVFHLAAKYPPGTPYKLWKVTFLEDWSSYASLQTAHWHQICEWQMAFSARQVPRCEAYQDANVSRNELQQNFLSTSRAVCRLSGLHNPSGRVLLVTHTAAVWCTWCSGK